jgi:hypothetical protein
LQLNFLAYRRDRVPHLGGYGFQFIRRHPQPPGPGPNLSRLGHLDLVANRRMFDAMHDGVLRLGINGIQSPSFHFACDRAVMGNLRIKQGRPKAALSLDH